MLITFVTQCMFLSLHCLYLHLKSQKYLVICRMCVLVFFLHDKWPIFAQEDLPALFLTKESMSLVSFQIWRIMVIEVHKQPAEGVRFPVTSRRFSLKTKRVEKGIVIAAPWHIGTKAQREWFILLFEARNTVSALPLLKLCWQCTWGGQHHARQCEACPRIYSMQRDSVHKRRRENSGSGLGLSGVGLPELEQSAWDIFETQVRFVTEEKTRWEVMTTHEN